MSDVLREKIGDLLKTYPFLADFFDSFGISPVPDLSIEEFLKSFSDEEFLKYYSIAKLDFKKQIVDFVNEVNSFSADNENVESLTIIGGTDKSGGKEDVKVTVRAGEVVCVVGPTGAGKSRLLADIDWLAQGDTPTGRYILINGKLPDRSGKFSGLNKLVAQVSQNMNFVVDLTVREFLMLHAESRFVDDPDDKVREVIDMANELSGECFSPDSALASLSGGQSRALMICDTAVLSGSSIVLIDEIENAGIDRKRAVELFVRKNKIVFMATHDPVLALMGTRRLVVENGAIRSVIETSAEEKEILDRLLYIDKNLLKLRDMLRSGQVLKKRHLEFFSGVRL